MKSTAPTIINGSPINAKMIVIVKNKPIVQIAILTPSIAVNPLTFC